MKRVIGFLTLLILLGGCEKNLEFSPSEVRLSAAERDLNEKNIAKLRNLAPRDTVRFVVIGDSQRFYDEFETLVAHLNTRKGIDFLLLNGDITDFGQNREYRWIYRTLNKLSMPFIGVIGNHDMLGNGRQIYNEMFGPENFSFTVNGCRFVCLNSNSQECGFNGSIPDMPWLHRQVSDTSPYNNLFVISHIPPSSPDFDQRMKAEYGECLAANNKTRLSIHSHEHNYSYGFPFGGTIPQIVTSSVNKRSYLQVNVIGNEVATENVEF